MSALPISPQAQPVRHLQLVDQAYMMRLRRRKDRVRGVVQEPAGSASAAKKLGARVGLVVCLGLALLLGGGIGLSLPGATYSGPTASYTVSSGETLWYIAKYVAGNASVADTVEHIKDLNGLRSSKLYPGQQLSVPSR